MKKKDFKRLSKEDQKAIKELIRTQPTAILGKKEQIKKDISICHCGEA